MRMGYLGLSILALISLANCGGGSNMMTTPPQCVNTATTICTRYGQVQGNLEGSLRAFRGIPFAAPPVGSLRWKPPVPHASWQGVRSAVAFGNMCPQTNFASGVMGNEDCLYLNVYTSNPPPTTPQPVMVFFHGGGLALGSTQDAPYVPTPPLAGHGVVLVTAEYRLGLLGFYASTLLTTEGGGTSGNYGLMDSVAALQWVHDNIAGFGGDPSRVMMFGQSAGAVSVQALLVSPLAQGLFARAGVESSALSANALGTSIADIYPLYAPFPGLVGCDTATDVLACMRAVPADTVVLTQQMSQFPYISINLDPVVIPVDPFTKLQQQGSPVPLLIGSTTEEATGLGVDPTMILTEAQYEAAIHTQFDPFGSKVAATVLNLYPASAYTPTPSPTYANVAVQTDVTVTKDTRNLARAVTGAGRPAVWRYLFHHWYENDSFLNQLRAFHTAELPFVFGNLNTIYYTQTSYIPTAAETALSTQMMDYWAQFAAAGDPNVPGATPWLSYDTVNENILEIDDTSGTINGYNNPQCDFLSTLPLF
jgi:para-nitrobenzyl esterase